MEASTSGMVQDPIRSSGLPLTRRQRALTLPTLSFLFTLALASGALIGLSEDVPDPQGPVKMYLYDLPKYRNVDGNLPKDPRHAGGDISDSDYGLDQIFPMLLKDSPYITKDPEEADYFGFDAWLFWPHATIKLEEVIADIKKLGPWYERKNGTDHIFLLVADQGRCQYEEGDRQPHSGIRNSIIMQHYGGTLHSTDFFGPHAKDYVKQKIWGGNLDRELVWAESMSAKDHCDARNVRCTIDRYGRRVPFLCNIPFQDMVIPPAMVERPVNLDCHHCSGQSHGKPLEMASKIPWLDPQAEELSKKRVRLLFHAGSAHFHSAPYYSLGARQTMIEMFGRHKQAKYNMSLVEGGMGNEYFEHLLTSVFCLATTGTGWGGRLKMALTRGCIPVIMHDGIYAEFEQQLPIHEYMVRLPYFAAYASPEILQSYIDTGRAAEMQANIACAWRLHWWRRPHGKALDVVMCDLQRRKMGLKGPMAVDFKACTLTCFPGAPPMPINQPSSP